MPMSHPHVAEKMRDFLLPQKQWSLFMPTQCDVSAAKMKRGKPWSNKKKDHLQKDGFVSIQHCPWALPKTGKLYAKFIPSLIFELFLTVTMREVLRTVWI